ncbi:MAG: LptF/LptG family permease [Bacteroidales bacterium]|jgi:lipopolysaccharide export system permease protein|nr:LptF/LptG family permease [Bacteroidales bacterium]
MRLNKFKLGKLDAYIIRQFLGTFFFSILLIILIVIIFDISEKIDDFLEKHVPLKAIVFDYYLNFIPYFVTLFSSLFIFIAVIFFTSKLAYNSEIIPILSSGISFRRFLYPYFISACILTVFIFFLNDVVMPTANRKRLAFEDVYTKPPVMYMKENVHKQVEPGLFVYLESFNRSEQAIRFSMEKYDNDRLTSKLISDKAVWDKEKEKWVIMKYYVRDIDSLGHETLSAGESLDTTINLHPTEFKRRDNFVEQMNMAELSDFIEELRMEGSDNINQYIIKLHERIAGPFSTFILTLIGVSLSSRKVRGGIGIHVAIGITLCFLYILFMRFSSEFASKGNLSPVFAAWIPNFIFGLIGILLYRLTPK